MKKYLLLLALFWVGFVIAQPPACSFRGDTVFITKTNKTVEGEILETTLKNKSIIQLIRTEGDKFYLKMIVTENLYFDKVDQLEIISGSKSIFYKDTRHFQYDKHRGYYMVEIFKNYALILKDNGITSIVFGKVETDFTKSDCNQIRQIAACFYDAITTKK